MNILPASFFINNRSKLETLLLPSSVVIISSNLLMPRNGDQYFPYRQSTDLYYLTGIKQPSTTLVIYPDSGPDKYKEILFIEEGNEKTERWEGKRISKKEASKISGIGNILYSNVLKKELANILNACSYIYFGTPEESKFLGVLSNEFEIRQYFSIKLGHLEEHKLAPLMTRIRMYKEPEELAMMKIALKITGDAFIKVLQNIKPGMMEFEIAAYINFEFESQGAHTHAFDPIMASGRNALILHYIENRSTCKDGDLLLMDFGADWQYYSADISRTIPINGRYNKRQREIYDANLRVMNKTIHIMKPGILIAELNEEVGKFWEEEHIKLGLYSHEDSKKKSKIWPKWQEYYWHGTSHSIGIDVHDTFDQSERLKSGMVLSCEPGIYIPEEGIGIRLENDILITEDTPVNLSENIPIDPDVIEGIINKL